MARTTHLELQRLADDVRHRSLGEVALLLGYRPDRSHWRRAGSVITVTGRGAISRLPANHFRSSHTVTVASCDEVAPSLT